MSPASHCAFRPCGAVIPRHLLMCAPHWRLVPRPIQDRVYRHYRAKDWTQWGHALDDARKAVSAALTPKEAA